MSFEKFIRTVTVLLCLNFSLGCSTKTKPSEVKAEDSSTHYGEASEFEFEEEAPEPENPKLKIAQAKLDSLTDQNNTSVRLHSLPSIDCHDQSLHVSSRKVYYFLENQLVFIWHEFQTDEEADSYDDRIWILPEGNMWIRENRNGTYYVGCYIQGEPNIFLSTDHGLKIPDGSTPSFPDYNSSYIQHMLEIKNSLGEFKTGDKMAERFVLMDTARSAYFGGVFKRYKIDMRLWGSPSLVRVLSNH